MNMNNKKILIVYYSLQSNTSKIANIIHEVTEGDIFEIKLEKPYNLATSATIGLMHTRNGHTPALKNHVVDIEAYDVIFVGSPIWWYTATPPIMSFLKEYNLENKTVIPFCTHGGNYGDFFTKIKNHCPNSIIIEDSDFTNIKTKNQDELKKRVERFVYKSLS